MENIYAEKDRQTFLWASIHEVSDALFNLCLVKEDGDIHIFLGQLIITYTVTFIFIFFEVSNFLK